MSAYSEEISPVGATGAFVSREFGPGSRRTVHHDDVHFGSTFGELLTKSFPKSPGTSRYIIGVPHQCLRPGASTEGRSCLTGGSRKRPTSQVIKVCRQEQ